MINKKALFCGLILSTMLASSMSAEALKFNGDLRLRYQSEKRDNSSSARNRLRMRLRVGAQVAVTSDLKVQVGLASGAADSRSTNQTFQNSFQKYPVNISYAYATYNPFKDLNFLGGKMHHPLWSPTDMLWDTDINPDGFAVKCTGQVTDGLGWFATGTYFLLDELFISGKTGPSLIAFQPGMVMDLNTNTNLKAAFTYYRFNHVQGKVLTNGSATSGRNNSLTGGGLANAYTPIVVSGELGFAKVASLPYLSVTSEIAINPAVSSAQTGIIFGIMFGHKKVTKTGEWNAGINYRTLSRDAFPDVFPDLSFYGGNTGVKGVKAMFNYGLTDALALGMYYYHTNGINVSNPENFLEVDINTKF